MKLLIFIRCLGTLGGLVGGCLIGENYLGSEITWGQIFILDNAYRFFKKKKVFL